MKARITINVSPATEVALRRIAKEKGVTATRIVESAIDWFDRCERIAHGGRVTSVTVKHVDGAVKSYIVL